MPWTVRRSFLLATMLSLHLPNAFGQNTPAYPTALDGKWVFRSDAETSEVDASGKRYPIFMNTSSGRGPPVNAALRQKLLELREVLFLAFPSPFMHNFSYSLLALDEPRDKAFAFKLLVLRQSHLKLNSKTDPELFNFVANVEKSVIVDPVPLEVTINATDQTRTRQLFVKSATLSLAAKGAGNSGTTDIYIVPPQDNYGYGMSHSNYIRPSYGYKPDAAKYFIFKNIFQGSGYSPTTNLQTDSVVLSYNGKLPYTPISIEAFLTLLDASLKTRQQSALVARDKALNDASLGANARRRLIDDGTPLEADIKTIAELQRLYKSDLQNPAIILPEHRNLVDGNMDKYITGQIGNVRNSKGIFPEKLLGLFTQDPKLGFSVSKETLFFKSKNPEDWQMIQVLWRSKRPAVENTNDLLAKRYFHYAMENNIDWDRLAALLMK